VKRVTVCTTPGCAELVTRDLPCPQHGRPVNASWSPQRDRTTHHKLRAVVVKARGPRCERCGKPAEDSRGKGLQMHHVQVSRKAHLMSFTTSTSTNTLVRRPIAERHWPIQFDNADGTASCCACPINYDELYNLKGRLLTLIDATNGDQQQRKALKDLVWQTLQHWMKDIERSAGITDTLPLSGHSDPQ
jgi:hypothetical protein